MTLLVVRYDPGTGDILGHRHVSDHDYDPASNELIVEHGDARKLRGKRVDVTADPLVLADDSDAEWKQPGVVDPQTRRVIGGRFRQQASAALNAIDAARADDTIPDTIPAFFEAVLAMQYLTYLALTGERIRQIEQRLF